MVKRTANENGLKQESAVILSAESENGSIEIGISSKRPYVKYKISSGPSEKLTSTVRVNDLKIHTLRASQVGEKIRFSVDQELALEGRYRSPSKFNFNFETIKIGQKWENSENDEIEKLVGFRGCLYQGNCFTGLEKNQTCWTIFDKERSFFYCKTLF